MKMFNVAGFASETGGEYVLGHKDLHTRACYLIYGILEPREKDRLIKAGPGREEILCAIDGPIMMHTARGEMTLPKGYAVHVDEDETFFISNPADDTTTYIVAGGRADGDVPSR